MVEVEIAEGLYESVEATFKKEASKVFDLMESLKTSPRKGKPLGSVGGIVIKEIRYKSFRFYFITDGHKLKCLDEESLTTLLIRFVRMSDKKHQQQVIDEIKHVLRNLGRTGLT